MRKARTFAAPLFLLFFTLVDPHHSEQFVRAQETRQSPARTGTVSVRIQAMYGDGVYDREYLCWLYADRRLVLAQKLVKFKRVRVGYPTLEALLPPIELPPGKYTLDVAVELRFRSDTDDEFPFAGLSYKRWPHTVRIESGKNITEYIGISDEREHPLGVPFFPITKDEATRAQVLLDDLTKRVNETVQKINGDGTWGAFAKWIGVPGRKGSKYLYLDLSTLRGGGREFDEYQINLLADWLKRHWAWFPFPGLHGRKLPIDIDDMTEEQRKKYYQLVEIADGSIRSFEELRGNAIKLLQRDR